MARHTIDTDQIKRQQPITEVVTRYGVRLQRRGRNLMGLCPFHEEGTPSLSVDSERGLWYCFGCGLGGDVISFVERIEGVGFVEACRILSEGQLPELTRRVPLHPKKRPRQESRAAGLDDAEKAILDLAIRVYHTALVTSRKGPGSPYGYLLERGLTVETIQAFQVGHCSGRALMPALRYVRVDPGKVESIGLLKRNGGPCWEFFTDRITFVERDRSGRVIHMAGRALGHRGPKYLFLPGVSKPVYGLSRVRWSKPVFVVEGIFDYVTLRQWGYQGVATLGTSLKPTLARRLTRAPSVVFVPDNDQAGTAALARWRERAGQGVALRLPDDVKDVNDLMERDHPQMAFESALSAEVVAVASSLADYVTLWRWGYQAVAAVGTLGEADRRWLAGARRVLFVPGEGVGRRQVRRWQQDVARSALLPLPSGRSLSDLGRDRFRKLAKEKLTEAA